MRGKLVWKYLLSSKNYSFVTFTFVTYFYFFTSLLIVIVIGMQGAGPVSAFVRTLINEIMNIIIFIKLYYEYNTYNYDDIPKSNYDLGIKSFGFLFRLITRLSYFFVLFCFVFFQSSHSSIFTIGNSSVKVACSGWITHLHPDW